MRDIDVFILNDGDIEPKLLHESLCKGRVHWRSEANWLQSIVSAS
jgi:hypothetical protein